MIKSQEDSPKTKKLIRKLVGNVLSKGTQEEIASRLGINVNSFYSYCIGRRGVWSSFLDRVAAEFPEEHALVQELHDIRYRKV